MAARTNIPQDTAEDEKIVELYWKRNEKAIQQTDIKYGKFLFRIAYNILHDRCDCEECQNDTYLAIWNAIPPARPAVFPAFITQILRHIAINRYKEKRAKKHIPSEFTVSMEDLYTALHTEESVGANMEVEELGRWISDYVRKLSRQNRYIFVGRFYMAEPVEEIAKDLRLTSSSVYKAIDRIKTGLKNHLKRNGVIV